MSQSNVPVCEPVTGEITASSQTQPECGHDPTETGRALPST